MAVVRVVQVSLDEEPHVIAMRNGGVATIGAVLVRRLMAVAGVVRRAADWVLVIDVQGVLLHAASTDVVEVPVVQVVVMARMGDDLVLAVRGVQVIVVAVHTFHHTMNP